MPVCQESAAAILSRAAAGRSLLTMFSSAPLLYFCPEPETVGRSVLEHKRSNQLPLTLTRLHELVKHDDENDSLFTLKNNDGLHSSKQFALNINFNISSLWYITRYLSGLCRPTINYITECI